jgi:hypothetical protein
MIKLIHAALVAMPAFAAEPEPESPEERALRLQPVAAEIWDASVNRPSGYSRAQWAAVNQALAWHETRLAKYVHMARCDTGPRGKRECDSGKALGLFQVHRAACRPAWAVEPGSHDELRESAKCAARLLRYAHNRCVSRAPTALQGAFSGYAGASCTLRDAPARERTAWLIAARLGG